VEVGVPVEANDAKTVVVVDRATVGLNDNHARRNNRYVSWGKPPVAHNSMRNRHGRINDERQT